MKELKANMNAIRYYRIKKKLTQYDLAKAINVRPATVSHWENSRCKPQPEYIEKLSEVLGVPSAELYKAVYNSDELLINKTFPLKAKQRILVYGSISAGKPTFAQEEITDYTYVDINKEDDSVLFGLRVTGNSMNNAYLPDGSIAIVKQCSYVDNGTIAVVRVNDDTATVKKFYQEGKIVRLEPCSTDPSYKTQIYDLTKTRISIIGQVVECQIRM